MPRRPYDIAPDYENDRIDVAVKRDKQEEFCRSYREFGWELAESRPDARYGNIVHLAFRRPHSLPNKDALQLLQVRLEIVWNKIGGCQAAARLRSALSLVFGGALFAALLAAGILLFVFGGAAWAYAVGGVCCGLGLVCGAGGAVLSRLFYVKDARRYGVIIGQAHRELESLCRKARALREEDTAQPASSCTDGEGGEVHALREEDTAQPAPSCMDGERAEAHALREEDTAQLAPSCTDGERAEARALRGEESHA